MRRRLTLCRVTLTIIVLATSVTAQAQFPANSDFTDGAAAWSLPDGAHFVGDALSLAAGTALSDRSAGPLSGWHRVEVRLRGPGGGSDSALGLSLAPAGVEAPAQVKVAAAEAGPRWRTLSAEILPPPGAPAVVAVGVEGADRWLIESVTVTPVDLPEPAASEDAPVFAEVLPEDWEPDGLLDAIERPLGRDSELLVNVGALEIGLPTAVEVSRAHRGSARLLVRTRATGERPLTVSVSGPPGVFAPERTVMILPGRDTTFKASLQAFFVGTCWARMTFRSGDHEASAPIRVTVEPSYPAPGVSFAAGDLPPTLLGALTQWSIPMIAAPLGPALPEQFTRLRLLPPPWTGDALRVAAKEAAGRVEFMALQHPRGEVPEVDPGSATELLRQALNESARAVGVLGPPADLQPGPPPKVALDDRAMIGELGAAGVISAPTLRLPVLEARPVRAVSLDRTPVEGAQPSWTAVAQALALGGVSSTVRERARMPMFFGELVARSSGSAEADALLLARTLVLCAYQGATGWTVPARAADAPEGATAFCPLDAEGALSGPVGEVYVELSRELAAAVPVVMLGQTAEIGSSPEARVGFRPFIRDDEGIVALWNNTGAVVELALEVRTSPLDMHTVTVGPEGVGREYEGAFRFSEDAVTLNRPVVFVTLQPAQLKVISMQLARPQISWLASVEPKPRIRPGGGERKGFLEEWGGTRGFR